MLHECVCVGYSDFRCTKKHQSLVIEYTVHISKYGKSQQVPFKVISDCLTHLKPLIKKNEKMNQTEDEAKWSDRTQTAEKNSIYGLNWKQRGYLQTGAHMRALTHTHTRNKAKAIHIDRPPPETVTSHQTPIERDTQTHTPTTTAFHLPHLTSLCCHKTEGRERQKAGWISFYFTFHSISVLFLLCVQ